MCSLPASIARTGSGRDPILCRHAPVQMNVERLGVWIYKDWVGIHLVEGLRWLLDQPWIVIPCLD